jgi:hypothetical protein
MEFHKFKGQVVEINGQRISIQMEDEDFKKLLGNLKVHDKVDVVVNKWETDDLQVYVKEFNKVFLR